MQWSVSAIKKGRADNLVKGLIITFLFGTAFVFTQYLAWSELFGQGIAFSSRLSDIKVDYTYVPQVRKLLSRPEESETFRLPFCMR